MMKFACAVDSQRPALKKLRCSSKAPDILPANRAHVNLMRGTFVVQDSILFAPGDPVGDELDQLWL